MATNAPKTGTLKPLSQLFGGSANQDDEIDFDDMDFDDEEDVSGENSLTSNVAALLGNMGKNAPAAPVVEIYDGAATMENRSLGLYKMVGRLERLAMYNNWGRGSVTLAYPDEDDVRARDILPHEQVNLSPEGQARNQAPTDWAREVLGIAEDDPLNDPFADPPEGEADKSKRRKSLAITGEALAGMIEGNLYELTGKPRMHPVHGESFDVISVRVICEVSREAIERYMSRNYHGIGPKLAARFVDRSLEAGRAEGRSDYDVLEDIRTTMVERPMELNLSLINKEAVPSTMDYEEGAQEVAAGEVMDDEMIQRRMRNLVAFVHREFQSRIGALGLGDVLLKLLAQHVVDDVIEEGLQEHDEALSVGKQGNSLVLARDQKHQELLALKHENLQRAWGHLAQNPYHYVGDVPGYGFQRADTVGKHLGIDVRDVRRLSALSYHVLKSGCERGGHVFLSEGQFRQACLEQDSGAGEYFDEMVQAGMDGDFIVRDDGLDDVRYYLPEMLEAECHLARNLVGLLSEQDVKPIFKGDLDAAIEEVGKAVQRCGGSLAENGLDEDQTMALARIITTPCRIHTLTAGPGCGKTALMEVLSVILADRNMLFCGPTGKSAKVLSSRVAKHGREARTINSLLRGAGLGSFAVNRKHPLEGDVLVSDETSMSDNGLMTSLLDAMPAHMHLILLGDDDQLPSVSPGRVLKDILQIEGVDHHRLTRTYRNSGGILDVVKEVREGALQVADRESVKFHANFDHRGAGSIRGVLDDYRKAVKADGIENVVLLLSRRKGNVDEPGLNTTYLNHVLRNELNPHALKVPGTRLFVGDRVLIRENMNSELLKGDDLNSWSSGSEDQGGGKDGQEQEDKRMTRVVNGDTGVITSFRSAEEAAGRKKVRAPESRAIQIREAGAADMNVQLDDGRLVRLSADGFNAVDHGYAMTVHSAQGSEYKRVMMVVTPGAPSFINRTMLFTGVSRPKDYLHVYGQPEVVRRVAATPMPERNSSLVERVCNAMNRELPSEVMNLNHLRNRESEEALKPQKSLALNQLFGGGGVGARRPRTAG